MSTSVHDVLQLAGQHQIKIYLNGDSLKLRAPFEPPAEILEQLRQWKPQIIRELSEPRHKSFVFTLDGCRSVTAIRPNGATLEEIQYHLLNQFGPGRVSDLRGCAHD